MNDPAAPSAGDPAGQALRKAEQRLRALIRTSSEAVYRMGPDFTEMWQLEGRGILADVTAPLTGWMQAYVDPDDHARLSAAIETALRDGAPFEMQHRVIRLDGTPGWIHSRSVPIRDDDGTIVEWFGTACDITERRATEAALAASQAEAERQRRLYEAILTNTPDLAYVWGRDHRFIYANEGLLQMWGRTLDEAVGRHCIELGYPDWHAAMHDREIEQVIATRRPVRGEVPFAGALGQRIYDYILVPVIGAGGEVEAVAGTTRDVTEARATEATLKLHAERLQLALDAGAIIGTWLWEVPIDRFTADERFARSYGVDPEVCRNGAPLRDVGAAVHPEDRPGLDAAIARALVTGGRYSHQYRVWRDGAYHWIEANGHLDMSADGTPLRFLGMLLDYDERHAAGEALRRQRTELERLVEERTAALLREVEERRRAEEALRQGEKLQAIGQLTGGIAHDFNNILQVVSSGVSLLEMPEVNERQRRIALNGMTKAAANAKELTGRLLAFARKQTLQPQEFDLNTRLAGMAELLESSAGAAVQVETQFAASLWPVLADPGQLEAAVVNLAVNARDAMPEGGRLVLATANATLPATAERAGGDFVSLSVRDTGKGMPPAVLARAFEPFFTTKGRAKGTGLGLAQVHGLVKQSGGDVQIVSAPGHGTTVTLHLPRAHGAAQPAGRAASYPWAEAHGAPVRPAGTPPPEAVLSDAAVEARAGQTVLVVDDNPEIAAFAASMLEGLGFTALKAGSAAEALAVLQGGARPDAVFSDIVMPGEMDGLGLAETLRASHPQIAVVLASGYSAALAENTARTAAEVLRKPYRLADLAGALERAIAQVRDPQTRPASRYS